ncbi:MAG: tyrosine--tRNA ligase [Bdellovibrionota bacterium]
MAVDVQFFKELEKREIVKQITDQELPNAITNERMTVYAGFDPTSDSLHVGSLLPLLTLRRFQQAGHKPIAVIGGATGLIGDPSGKTQERTLLSDEQIQKNLTGIKSVITKFLDISNNTSEALILNNADWFKEISYLEFLRDVGKHFTVNNMIAKESVRARLEDREHGISYTEFSYMILQAYDFLTLYDRHNCRLQIGGSDQWGNITAGIELIRRARHGHKPVYGLTHPLVMKADGTKFGKTEQGTIWLDAKKTSPYQFYQFFMQTADADVITYLKYFTFLSLDEISALESSLKTEPEKRVAQKALASEVTKLVHGEGELQRARSATNALFEDTIKQLDADMLLEVLSGAPKTKKSVSLIKQKPSLVDLLVDTALSPSKGLARKEITAGGIYVNNQRVTNTASALTDQDLIAGRFIVLRKGKKSYHLLEFI